MSNNFKSIQCFTVGDVIEVLEKLDPRLPVKDRSEGLDVVYFNQGLPDELVDFEEGGLWSQDEEEND